jgi:hypothetical protein
MSSHSSRALHSAAEEGGCGWCRGHYYTWSNEEPELIITLDEGERTLRRCRKCGSYWLENVFSFPARISEEHARGLIEGER